MKNVAEAVINISKQFGVQLQYSTSLRGFTVNFPKNVCILLILVPKCSYKIRLTRKYI